MAERKLITPRFRITVGDQVFTRGIRVECHSSLREQCSWATLEYDPGYAGLLDLTWRTARHWGLTGYWTIHCS